MVESEFELRPIDFKVYKSKYIMFRTDSSFIGLIYYGSKHIACPLVS